jgi:GntR family transcriptional regulator, carbon starvation induced regulator
MVHLIGRTGFFGPVETKGGAAMNEQLYETGQTAGSPARTMVEAAYERIRRDILSGKFSPGSKLRVEHLRAEYSVGGTTLREALSRLVGEALVVAAGQRGFRVAPMSVSDITDLSEMRKLLECHALRESIEHGDDEWEANVVAAFHRLSRIEERVHENPEELGDEWEDRNRAYHEALIAGCTNRWVLHFRKILYIQSLRYRRLSLISRLVPRDVHAEHTAIFEATLARDPDLACRLLADHVEKTQAVTVAIISRALADRSVGGGRQELSPPLSAEAPEAANRDAARERG